MSLRHIEGKNGIGPFLSDKDVAKAGLARTLRSAAKAWRDAYGDIALPKTGKPQETTVLEQLVLSESFTGAEKEALIADGALIYRPLAETIPAQRERQAKKGKKSFLYVVDAGDLINAVPSRPIEIAIYPAPDRFFVPRSLNKSVRQQEKLVEKDAQDLRQRLGLEHVTEIIPDEASTLSDITFQHLDATGVWLFGPEYAKAQGLSWVYGRTKNPTNSAGSDVARVGYALPDYGLRVYDWLRDYGSDCIGAVRVVVAVKSK